MQTTFAGAVHYGVFCRKLMVPKGTRFGPFRGKQVNTSEIKNHDDNSFMWEVGTLLTHWDRVKMAAISQTTF